MISHQKLTVEHINVKKGGKAVIGTVNNQINNNLGVEEKKNLNITPCKQIEANKYKD